MKKKKDNSGDAELKKDIDRVENAFRKFDVDGDGFVDWEEFQEVTKKMDPDQAKRIFNTCDTVCS